MIHIAMMYEPLPRRPSLQRRRENALGKTSSDGAKHWAGIAKNEKINRLVVESSKKSFAALFKKLK